MLENGDNFANNTGSNATVDVDCSNTERVVVMYLDGRREELGDSGLEFVGQRQLKDARLVNESVLDAATTQQLQRRDALQHDHRQHVTTDGDKDAPVIVTPRQRRHRLTTLCMMQYDTVQ